MVDARPNPPTLPRALPNRPEVVDQEFDGEGVIVHLGTGMYFALDDRGTAVWRLLSRDGDLDAAIQHLVDLDGTDASDASAAVRAFVRLLADESLVRIDGDLPPGDPPVTPIRLERFSDLQDVLLVDPIHDLDLDGDGWPIDAGSGIGRPPNA